MANTLSPDRGDQQFSNNRTIPRQRFQHSENVDGTGEWLFLPSGIGELLLSVDPESGTARIEYTQDSVAEVEAETAVGKAWTEGDVSVYASAVMANAVTAIRCVSTGPTAFRVTA